MILCNPHNPIGRLWSREELLRIGELCAKYQVVVIADEIHCDLTDPQVEYIPFASVSSVCENLSVTCLAPTKTFNLAGLQTAAIVVANPNLRHKVWRAINTDEIADPNVFAVEAAIAAFNHGEVWLDTLRQQIYANKQHLIEVLHEALPQLKVIPSKATYLIWIDCHAVSDDSAALAKFLRQETGLILNEGLEYGKAGEAFLRMNIAVSSARLDEGLQRLIRGIQAFDGIKQALKPCRN